jgi:hypothetical protein
MIYNPITDELLTSAVDGLKVWRLLKNEKENWKSIKPLSSYSLNLMFVKYTTVLFYYLN